MSFLSVIKNIENLFSTKINPTVTSLEPVISALPGGLIFNQLFNTIVSVENLFSGSVKAGTAKKAVVAQVMAATSPNVPLDSLSSATDNIVFALNSLQSAQANLSSSTVVPITK